MLGDELEQQQDDLWCGAILRHQVQRKLAISARLDDRPRIGAEQRAHHFVLPLAQWRGLTYVVSDSAALTSRLN